VSDKELVVGVVRERGPGERRVALSPDGVGRLAPLGLRVVVEEGAGARALFPDEAYVAAGASIATAAELRRGSDITVRVGPADASDLDGLTAGHVMVGLLDPLNQPDFALKLAEAKVTALSLEGLPRTLSRAQSMDVLTSQANVAGYQAVMVAASTYDGFFPMLTTAAGTTRPATVLVLGTGVAGLQALATARRLGAVTSGSDVRDAARAEVTSVGASFLDLGATATGAGGYARDLSEDERQAQQQAVAAAIARFDVVITTAQVPGRRPPLLVDETALAAMATGSVVIDLASGPLGGNVAGSVPDTTTQTANGVTVIGAGNLPSRAPRAASTAFSRNVCALLATLVKEGKVVVDLTDEVLAALVVTHDGHVAHPQVTERVAMHQEAGG
jgi:NAD(P) transhydrogenase subunit alpha